MKSPKFSRLRNLKNSDKAAKFARLTKEGKRRGWPLMVRRVSGHSMMPILPPGTYVIAWRWVRKLPPGSVIIFHHDGREKIKRLQQIEENGTLFVVGEHPEASTDSRHFGAIERDYVQARVIWPNTQPRI